MIPDSTSSLSQIAAQASASSNIVEKKTTSFGRSVTNWVNRQNKTIPDWCKRHIEIHQLFQKVLRETKLTGEEHTIPSEIMNIYKKSEEALGNITNVTYYPEFLKLINQDRVQDSGSSLSTLIERSDKTKFIRKNHTEWHLNTALLMDVYKKTANPELKKQIEFLILNYLAKAATVGEETGIVEMDVFMEKTSQLGAFEELSRKQYHRESSIQESLILKEIYKEFPADLAEKMYLVDSEEATSLLPIFFNLINASQNREENIAIWSTQLSHILKDYIAKNGLESINTPIDPPPLFDVTSLIAQYMKTNQDPEKDLLFHEAIENVRETYKLAIHQAISETCNELPKQEQEKLKFFLASSCGFISKTTSREIGILAKIDIFPTIEDYLRTLEILIPNFLEQPQSASAKWYVNTWQTNTIHLGDLTNFINKTGSRLGMINFREKALNFLSLEKILQNQRMESNSQITHYSAVGGNPIVYPTKTDVLSLNSINSFKKTMISEEFQSKHPECAILGKGVIDIFNGLLNEITEQQWVALNANPDTRMLIQTSLVRAINHFAKAQAQSIALKESRVQSPESSFTEFAQTVELIQCEISTLLAITKPFKEEDFESIYKGNLAIIPENLRKHLKVGVTKSAMNTFAGVNAAVRKMEPKPECVYMENSYFESIAVIGETHTAQAVIDDTESKKINLFTGEFNHNINVHATHFHYTVGDMTGDIDRLLAAKPDTTELTVTVDCTVDFVNSPKVRDLLQHYEAKIESGLLNFVFFRSGQKFDMLGVDNYYGSPFYIVNNGNLKWSVFDNLITSPAHKTDPLSMQWFCLSNKYALDSMENYRKEIFKNAKNILSQIPRELTPAAGKSEWVSTCDENMEASFIDIKLVGSLIDSSEVKELFLQEFSTSGSMAYSRSSFGFYHPNINIIPTLEGEGQNVRINPGLDPKDNDKIISVLNKLVILIEKNNKEAQIRAVRKEAQRSREAASSLEQKEP